MRVLFKNSKKGLEAVTTYVRVRMLPPMCADCDVDRSNPFGSGFVAFWEPYIFYDRYQSHLVVIYNMMTMTDLVSKHRNS